MKKYLLGLIFLFGIFLIPTDVFASANRLQVRYRNDQNTAWVISYDSTNTCYTGTPSTRIYGQLIRWQFSDQLQAGTTYHLSFTFSTMSRNDYAWLRWEQNSWGGILIGSTYASRKPYYGRTLSQSSIPFDYQTTMYSKSSFIQFEVTPSSTNSFSLDVPTDLLLYQQICIDGYQIEVASNSSSNQDSQAIINNNNSNTNAIINNDNRNTTNIINSQNETTEAINDINDTLQDTEITGDSIGGKLADIESISDTPITDLITLPITLIQNIYNSISGSCSSYSLPFGFGLTNYTLTLPCIDLGHEKYLGRVVWGRVDDLFCIFILFFLFKMIIWFFTNWSTLKDNFGYLIDPSNRGLF